MDFRKLTTRRTVLIDPRTGERPAETDDEGRMRFTYIQWPRSPDGQFLEKNRPPRGIRTPNEQIWGHELDEFGVISRHPNPSCGPNSVGVVSMYSRSQIKVLGEIYDDGWFKGPLLHPRLRRPWPVLKLPKKHPAHPDPPLGAIDGGCEEEHADPDDRAYTMRWDEFSDDTTSGEATSSVSVSEDTKGEKLDDSEGGKSEGEAPQHASGLVVRDDAWFERLDELRFGRFCQHAPGLFSTRDLPKLEEFIPEALFPDILLVYDPCGLLKDPVEPEYSLSNSADTAPIKYKRMQPILPHDSSSTVENQKDENVAELHLYPSNRIGFGNHSIVYRAPLTLPAPLSARSRTGQCTVAVKLAQRRCTAHGFLQNEGEVYASFPKDAQEEYCGYNIIPPCRYPVPVGAVVPKFFGYYVPAVGADKLRDKVDRHAGCDERSPCRVSWMSPILLMEECGEPVKPAKLTPDQRTECLSLAFRLNLMSTIQGSMSVRNIMIQPGPLTAPPSQRSFDTPSFRIIDFGRGGAWYSEELMKMRLGWSKEKIARESDNWRDRLSNEMEWAMKALMTDWDYGALSGTT